MIKACIFDLDGVIVDTAKYHFIAWRRLANELGFDFDESFNERLKGVSRMESLDLILQHGGISISEDRKKALAAKKNEWYRAFILKMKPDEILEGALPFLAQLQQKNIKLALGSASKNARTILEQLQLIDTFEVIVDGTKTTRSKPDPQVFQLAAQGLKVSPDRCIVFEDAATGVEAAIAGGFWAVGIGKEENLEKAHLVLPNFVGIDFDNLVAILQAL